MTGEAAEHSDDPLALARPVPAGAKLAPATIELSDGYETPAHVYEPAAGHGPKPEPVVYLHGIQSHPGWFSGSAAALAAAGIPVVMPTRRGSGANRVARGDAPSAAQLLDDVAACCRWALRRFDATRVRLVGVSWGGKLAAVFCARGRAGLDIASLTMIAPGIAPQIDVPLKQKLAIGMALLGRSGPGRPRGTALFDIPLSDPALFTDNPEMREYLQRDAHRLHRATARFLFASSRLDAMLRRKRGQVPFLGHDGAAQLGERINSKKRYLTPFPHPTTLILATRDRIIDNAATRRVVERLTGGRARIIELDGAHTMDFEPDPTGFCQALLAAHEDQQG